MDAYCRTQATIFALFVGAATLAAADFRLPSDTEEVLETYCYSCHDEDVQKGELRLDNLGALKLEQRLALLNRVHEQVHLQQMPPEKKKQPSEAERQALVEWVGGVLKQHDAAKLAFKLQMPDYGNYLDHEQLFSGEHKHLKGFTYERDWLISEFIFKEKINVLLKRNRVHNLDGEKQTLHGARLTGKIANPFTLPDRTGVRYYANEKINSSHFLSMMGNAKYVAAAMVQRLSQDSPDYLPAVTALTKMEREHAAILASRQAYLEEWVDFVCAEVFGDANESMLPTYEKIELDGEISEELRSFGKNGWKGRVGINGPFVVNATQRFARPGKDKLAIIRECEAYWFHKGHERAQIARLINTLRLHLASIMKYAKHAVVLPQRKRLSDAEMEEIKATVKELRTSGTSYKQLVAICMTHWRSELKDIREKSDRLSDELIHQVVSELYEKLFERRPTEDELVARSTLFRSYASKIGMESAATKLAQTLLLDAEFITRSEYGSGKADEYGRKLLSPRDASYAIAYALTDRSPDAELRQAVREGRLSTRADYKRQIERLLNDRSHYTIVDPLINETPGVTDVTTMPIRKLRFFREFFGYHLAMNVFKDQSRFGASLPGSRERLIAEADLLLDYVITRDKAVFETLLTTDEFYVFHSGVNESMQQSADSIKLAYEYFKAANWKSFTNISDLFPHEEFLQKKGLPGLPTSELKKAKQSAESTSTSSKKPTFDYGEHVFTNFINAMCALERRFDGGNHYVVPLHARDRITRRNAATMKGVNVARFFNVNPSRWDYKPVQPAKVSHRMGMLTHPAWLQAFSKNDHTDPVTRGKWIREKLLAGTVPDIPIGVDAVVPKDHTRTFRARLEEVTTKAECWRCHQYMNPLGNAFEAYDDFGRYRTEEELEHPDNAIGVQEISHHKKKIVKLHPSERRLGRPGKYHAPKTLYKTLPVVTTGVLDGTGDENLDGDVQDAHDLIGRLAQSERVRQSIIRHAFRYFMGRNEMLSDSKTLIDADQAYLASGGSFDAVIVSLLTSDSFIYRQEAKQ